MKIKLTFREKSRRSKVIFVNFPEYKQALGVMRVLWSIERMFNDDLDTNVKLHIEIVDNPGKITK